MDFEYPPQADTYRTKVRSFLDANLPKDWKGIGSLNHAAAAEWTEDWRKKLYSEGLLAITWPKEYGGQGLSHIESLVLAEEFARAGVPAGGPNDGFGIGMLVTPSSLLVRKNRSATICREHCLAKIAGVRDTASPLQVAT